MEALRLESYLDGWRAYLPTETVVELWVKGLDCQRNEPVKV
jgi:hypothetical protein